MSKLHFIATAHEEYRQRKFEPGDIVIDPWRMIPDQPGVTVKRIGQNRPAIISVLVPSRGRPDWLGRMIQSLHDTVTFARFVELVVWLDEDDPRFTDYWKAIYPHPVNYLTGPRMLLSECWNACASKATGEILMHCGDDLTFDTVGWDQQVRAAFSSSQDKILFVHGDDLGPHGKEFGTHGFLHRRWVETLGYFVPPLFSSDWNDVWLNEIANMLDRRQLLDFVTEHRHYTFGKSERDQTHAEREERGLRDDVVGLYKRTKKDRELDAKKLRAVIEAYSQS